MVKVWLGGMFDEGAQALGVGPKTGCIFMA